jgi:hypothetical protein
LFFIGKFRPVIGVFVKTCIHADGTRIFKWNKILDADLSGYIVKHGTGGWDAMNPLYDGVVTTNVFESNGLAKGSYTFAIKAIDSSSKNS